MFAITQAAVIGDTAYSVGDILRDDQVTTRMKELNLVRRVQDVKEVKEVKDIEEVKVQKSKKKKREEILTEDSAKWISLHRTSNNIPKMLKKLGSPFNVFSGSEHVSINIIDKETYSGEYYDKERQKILNAIYFSEVALDLLAPYLDENTTVGMEGLSFGSSGNSLIDISMTTALIRAGVVKKINPDNFFVISPTTLKKFAVKGNAKKDELYCKLIEDRISEDRLKPLLNVLKEYVS